MTANACALKCWLFQVLRWDYMCMDMEAAAAMAIQKIVSVTEDQSSVKRQEHAEVD